MTWLAFVLALQIGWATGPGLVDYIPPLYGTGGYNLLYQQAEAKAVLFKALEVGGSARVQGVPVSGGFFANQVLWSAFADVLAGPFTIGWRYEYIHPAYGITPPVDEWTDEVYARFELKLGG